LTGRRERKKHELRERILDVATELVAARGLQATRVDEIAEQVDISQTTFFNYFRSKADLLDALMARLLDALDLVLDEARAAGAPAPERLRIVFTLSADLRGPQQRLAHDLMAESLRAPAASLASMRRLRSIYGEIIESGQAAGEVRTDQPADVLADAVIGLYTGVVVLWTADEGYPVAERFRTTAGLVVDLVSPA
jgi:AcrR family transcriptional regulator